MYRTLLTIALISMVCGIASAKSHGSHRPGPGHNPATRLIEVLDLSPAQSEQVEAIFAAAREQHDATNKLQREDHCAIRASVDAQLMEVFSEEQQAEFEKLRQEHRRHRPGPSGSRNAPPGAPSGDC